MILYILLFIFVFLIILWALQPRKKPVTFTAEDRAVQKECLKSIDESWRKQIFEMKLDDVELPLDDMGIKAPPDNKF